MRFSIFCAAAITVCLPLSLAEAQDRVVVIPLNTSKYVPGGVNTVTSAGQVWLDRNLGALRVATKSADPDSYGTLYQWGRLGDGHEYRSSSITSHQSITDDPGHGSFITGSLDWRTSANNNLWQGVAGINNPCPAGFRLPTAAEWEIERASWSSGNSAGALASPLKLVSAGYRNVNNGMLNEAGRWGYYWSSTVGVGSSSSYLGFDIGLGGMEFNARAYGFSVRCLKD